MQKSIVVLTLLFFLSCTEKKEPKKETNVLPYKEMLLTELNLIKTSQNPIYRYTINTEGNIQDSVLLDTTAFQLLTNSFLSPYIGDDKLKNNYTEKSFDDLSSGLYNFSYETSNQDLSVKTLILSFSKEDQSKLKSLQITKSFSSNGKNTLQRLYWKTNQYFTISTSEDSNKTETNSFIKVVWSK